MLRARHFHACRMLRFFAHLTDLRRKKWNTGYRLGDKNFPPPPPAVARSAPAKQAGPNAMTVFRAADADSSGEFSTWVAQLPQHSLY